jgi:Cof subfamily protein (haloacid dehalogenase superfamily)
MTEQPHSNSTIRLIATDIDGTLLNSRSELSERAEKALKAAIEQDVQIVLATGKTFHSGHYVINKAKLNTPGIYVQGTVTYNSDGTIRTQQTLDTTVARQAITFAEDRGYVVSVYSGTRILVRKMHERIQYLAEHYHEPVPEAVGPLQNILGTIPVNKVLFVSPGDDGRRMRALRWQLNAQLDGAARLLQAGVPDMLEMLPPGASKGAALRALLKELRIDPSQVMAIGDAENDLEMIQMAGVGVAVGNAEQALKDTAKYTVASNNDDGFAEAVERFVLPPKAPPVAPAAPPPAPAQTTPETKPEGQPSSQ